MKLISVSLLALFALAGCQSYDIMQRNVFSDDDGNIVNVDYGRAEKEHKNTFISPMTGKEMEYHSKLLVVVELPDGEKIKAWQCMNFQRTGTMYKSDNGLWLVHVNGFTTLIYRQTEEDETRYREIYRGVLCSTPKNEDDKKKSDKWRKLKKDANGKWH
ncbi:MAG: hypothetical protein MJ109_05050 [Kiritimatiellae bacterium]|nr:hypothetical protein [Kiritimatiellia bacterium]